MNRKKIYKKIAALFLLFTLVSVNPAYAKGDSVLEIIRISSDNRYSTAIEVSKTAFKQGDYVVVANGLNFPDALAGGPLAAALKAPILLTGKDSIPDGLLKEIVDLKARNVIVLGGTGSISEEVVKQIMAVANVERLSGDNRYLTATAIAERVQEITGSSTVAVANGTSFPDVLSASGYLGNSGIPIILTGTDTLDPASSAYIKEHVINRTLVLGGTGSVSDAVAKKLPAPTRIAGANRFNTSIELARIGFDNPETVIIVNGREFPDALSASALSGIYQAPILLTNADELPDSIGDYLVKIKPKRILVIGGKESVTPEVIGEILYLLGKGGETPKPLVFEPNKFYDEYAHQVLDSINTVRASQGLKPYVWDDELAKAAKIRAEEITVEMSHTRPDGTNWSTVSPLAKGENLISLNILPNEVVSVLMSTSGNSGNILRDRSDFVAMGIACRSNKNGDAFWALLYGTKAK